MRYFYLKIAKIAQPPAAATSKLLPLRNPGYATACPNGLLTENFLFKCISANSNLKLNPNSNLTRKHKTFSRKGNDVIFRASVQIPSDACASLS